MAIKVILLFACVTYVVGGWHKGAMESVKVGLIHLTLKETTPISCQLKCKLMSKCKAIGFETKLEFGKALDCYVLEDNNTDVVEETVELFVLRKVCLKLYIRTYVRIYLNLYSCSFY